MLSLLFWFKICVLPHMLNWYVYNLYFSERYEELVGARGEEISSPLASAYDMSIDDDAINSGIEDKN
jgi:hypothetical protein